MKDLDTLFPVSTWKTWVHCFQWPKQFIYCPWTFLKETFLLKKIPKQRELALCSLTSACSCRLNVSHEATTSVSNCQLRFVPYQQTSWNLPQAFPKLKNKLNLDLAVIFKFIFMYEFPQHQNFCVEPLFIPKTS